MAQKLKKKNTSVKKIVKKAPVVKARVSAGKVANQETNFTIPNVEYVEAVGRRKTAIARVRLYKKPGDFVVNQTLVGTYFSNISQAVSIYNLPFVVTDTVGDYAVTVKVSGSGISSQAGAVSHGLSRCLVALNPDFRTLLKKAGLLTRDDRMKETRKIGTGGKARRKRQSPKR